MRVALVTDKFYVGGGLEHIYQICKGMSDIEFGVFANGGEDYKKFKNLDNVNLFFDYKKNTLKYFSPDIIHIHHLKPLLSLYNINFAKKIFTVHGIHLHKYEFMKGIKPKILKFLRIKLEKYLYSKIDKIITVSDDDRDFLKRYYNINSEVIYNGIDFSPIKSIKYSKDELRRKFNFSNDKTIFLTVARFDFSKGIDVLVKSINYLKELEKLKDKLFVLVGEGDLLEPIKEYVFSNKLDKYVKFLGKRDDVYNLMKMSDFLILPSRWEGLPITLIEAYYCKLNYICSNTYGNRTVFNLIKGGVLFENENYRDLANKIINVREIDFSNYDFSLNKVLKTIRKIYEN